MGIAKACARGKTDTSKDEETIVELETTIELQLQTEAGQSSEHSKAIEDTYQRLLTTVSQERGGERQEDSRPEMFLEKFGQQREKVDWLR